MPPAVAKAPARKRHRKRKRRAASTSSSSSSSSSSESDSDEEKPLSNTTTIPVKPIQPQEPSESESSSESSLESDSEPEESFLAVPVATSGKLPPKPTQIHHGSPSPSPPPTELPTFLPDNNKGEQDNVAQEQLMKDKFRKFWMASIADGFRDDLEEIRKEPNLGPSRLSLLIDSLASGADVFSSSRSEKSTINEVEVILE